MRKSLWLLRIVIIAGAFAGIIYSRAPQLASWSLSGDSGAISRTLNFESRSVVRVALTMLSLTLL
jgi:hypothetical protein